MSDNTPQTTIPSKQPNILIVDDRQENLLSLEAILDEIDNINIIKASSGQAALAHLLDHEVALLLLDVQMPDMDGYEVANIMTMSPTTANIPIIFLTAISKEEHFVQKGYLSGAVDYIAKPLDSNILLSKVKIFLKLWIQSNELKQLSQKYQQALAEITRQRDALNELALKDHLTGIYQRRAFDDFLRKEISKSIRYQRTLSLAMLDLDHFKKVNDNYGHTVGDEVLVVATQQFSQSLRESDVICRYGGEEFVILMPDTQLNEALICCERIRKTIEELIFNTSEGDLKVTLSIGVAEFHLIVNKLPEQLLKEVDDCLYIAKHNGRNQVYSKPIDQQNHT